MNQFKSLNKSESAIFDGTHLQGYIDTSYEVLLSVFGEPTPGDGHKVDAEWLLQLEDGRLATIYNYKTGRNYLGPDGLDTGDIRDWHIGGHDITVVAAVSNIIKEHCEKRIKELE